MTNSLYSNIGVSLSSYLQILFILIVFAPRAVLNKFNLDRRVSQCNQIESYTFNLCLNWHLISRRQQQPAAILHRLCHSTRECKTSIRFRIALEKPNALINYIIISPFRLSLTNRPRQFRIPTEAMTALAADSSQCVASTFDDSLKLVQYLDSSIGDAAFRSFISTRSHVIWCAGGI